MATRGDGCVGVIHREAAELSERSHDAIADQLQAAAHLELLHILGQVAGGHPEVD